MYVAKCFKLVLSFDKQLSCNSVLVYSLYKHVFDMAHGWNHKIFNHKSRQEGSYVLETAWVWPTRFHPHAPLRRISKIAFQMQVVLLGESYSPLGKDIHQLDRSSCWISKLRWWHSNIHIRLTAILLHQLGHRAIKLFLLTCIFATTT